MAIRRDYTNGSGYVCPTENKAVRNLDTPPERAMTVRPYKTVLREADCRRLDRKTPMQQLAEIAAQDGRDNEQLKKVRQLWAALASIAQMLDFSIVSIEIKAKGGGGRYCKTETMTVPERK